MDLKIIKQNCNDYLRARKKFLEFAKSAQAQGLLNGNDNIIGSRIGEFIAWELLDEKGRTPKINPENNTADYDIICDCGETKITVKLISAENKNGRTTRLGEDWNEFILIILNKEYKIDSVGKITKENFLEFIKNRNRSKTPYASRTMLGKRGLFRLAKTEIYEKNLEKYL